MAKPQKSTAQSEVPGLVKKGPLYYLKRDWQLYALMLLPMVFIIVFKYFAYTGLSVAFLDYKIGKGYAGSKFVGLKIFEKVFKHRDFTKAVVNTLLLNVLDLIFSFPMPIILALLLNEIRVKWFKRTTQTLLYLPHFLSWVVIGAVAYQMFATQSGVVNVPTSNEELKTAMQAFKDAGLGVENAPLITKSFTYFYNWIPEGTSDDELAQYLDLNVAPFTWTATKNYLQDMNEKYNAGIVDPEFYLTTDDTLAKGKFVSGQCATYSFYMSSGTDVFSSLLANDPNAEVAVMSSTASGTVADGFTAHYYEYPSYGMIMGINANATAEERAATYMFLDWMSQPDNLKYLQYGEEGKTYNVVDGINVYNTDYTGDDKLSNNNNKDYWCLVQEVQHYGDEAADLQANKTTLAPAGYDWVVQDAYDLQKKGESGGIITPIFSKAVQATTEYSADLNSLWQEAYVDCVTCGPDEFESKYEEYCQEYLDAGYQEILDEKASLIADGNVLVVK